MAHNDVPVDSNVVDVAFSKSGTRIAVLMRDCFSIYMWSLKTRPVPSPILESSHPLPDNVDNRPRQIAFLNENEVYILRNSGPNSACIQRTTLETRSTTTVYQTTDSEQIITIFPTVGHEALWLSHVRQPGRPIAHSILKAFSEEDVQVDSWDQSPAVDTHWARAVHLSDDEVLFSLLTID
jgi:elongator complex protein 1